MSTNKYDATMATSYVAPVVTPLVAFDPSTDLTLDIRGYKEKALLVTNTGSNSASYSIMGSLDEGATFPLTIQATTAVAPSAFSLYRDSNYCTTWLVRYLAATTTTVVTTLAAIGD